MTPEEKQQKKADKLVSKTNRKIQGYDYKRFRVPAAITANPDAMLKVIEHVTSMHFFYDFKKQKAVECLVNQMDRSLFQNVDFMVKAGAKKYKHHSSDNSIIEIINSELYNKNVALALVKSDASNLAKVGRHRNDIEVVYAAVMQDGDALQYAGENVKDDNEVVRVAISKSPTAIQYASQRLRDDATLGRYAVSKSGEAFQYLSERLRGNKEIAMIAAKDKEALAIRYATDEMKDDADVAMTAVRANGDAIAYVSVEQRSEHDIVSEAIKKSPTLIKQASNRYLYSEPLLFKAVLQDASVLQFVPEEMRKVMVEMLDNYEKANPNFKASAHHVETEYTNE